MYLNRFDYWQLEPDICIEIFGMEKGCLNTFWFDKAEAPTNKRKVEIPINVADKVPPYTGNSIVETSSIAYYMSGTFQMSYYNADTGRVTTTISGRGWCDCNMATGRAVYPDSNGALINTHYSYSERLCITQYPVNSQYDTQFHIIDNLLDARTNNITTLSNSTTYIFVARGFIRIDSIEVNEYETARIVTQQRARVLNVEYLTDDTILAVIKRKVI